MQFQSASRARLTGFLLAITIASSLGLLRLSLASHDKATTPHPPIPLSAVVPRYSSENMNTSRLQRKASWLLFCTYLFRVTNQLAAVFGLIWTSCQGGQRHDRTVLKYNIIVFGSGVIWQHFVVPTPQEMKKYRVLNTFKAWSCMCSLQLQLHHTKLAFLLETIKCAMLTADESNQAQYESWK